MPRRYLPYTAITVFIVAPFLLLSLDAMAKSSAGSLLSVTPLLWRKALHIIPLVPPYRAPTMNCDGPHVVQGSYAVFLHHGSSLEKHIRNVQRHVDLDSKISYISPRPIRGPLYHADNVDDVTVDVIRADVTVDLVECDMLITDPGY